MSNLFIIFNQYSRIFFMIENNFFNKITFLDHIISFDIKSLQILAIEGIFKLKLGLFIYD